MSWMNSEELARFKRCGRGVLISKDALIFGHENIEIGENVRIDAHARLLASKGFLKIGSNVHVSCGVTLLCGGGITIKDHVCVSFDAKLISASDDSSGDYLVGAQYPSEYTNVQMAPIVLERLSWCASGAMMLHGSKLEEGAVLGAMSLLGENKTAQAWGIYVGIPIKRVKERSQKCASLAAQFEVKVT